MRKTIQVSQSFLRYYDLTSIDGKVFECCKVSVDTGQISRGNLENARNCASTVAAIVRDNSFVEALPVHFPLFAFFFFFFFFLLVT